MAILQRLRDVGYAFFFLFHLATTLVADTQALFQRSLFPPVLVQKLDEYVKDFKDPLILNGPVWFKSILYLEVVAMVPFLVVGFFGALLGARWMRTPSIIYGTAVYTMVIPMVATILFEDFKGLKNAPKTQEERYVLAGIYGVFGVIGLFIALDHALFRGKPASAGYQGRIGETTKNSQKKKN